jgi:phage terminase large subunit-like protein
MLRGPQHHFAWCDELAKWPRGDQSWDNLQLGMRLGEMPRTVVTTTPQPIALLRRILALRGTARTAGRTADNPHLPARFRDAMTEMYGGSRLGRQELDGILFEDFEGALWTREMLDGARLDRCCDRSGLRRVVVGVDPPASASGDGCGIVVCGIDDEGVVHVLADVSVAGLRPEGWARRVAAAAAEWGAQKIVAEKNQGGDMVESVLRGVESTLPVRLVAATTGKAARAEPVALRFETGRARLAGFFPELEDEMCAFTFAGYQGPGSPDRADAMVWAMSELIGKPKGEPRIGLL